MTEIVFIGTGAGGSPGSRRWRTSTLLESHGLMILVDCGVGCHYRLSDAGLLADLDAVLVTHDHMDHFLGIPELLFQAHMDGRRKHLTIYAPRVVEEVTRLAAPSLYKEIGYSFDFKPLEPGLKINLGPASVEAYRSCHATASDPYSFKIVFPDVSLGFSGDTVEPCSSILDAFRGVDILVHEATCSEEYRDPCNYYGHSTTRQALEAALDMGSDTVILNHIDERFNSNVREEAESLSGKLGVKALVPEDGYIYRYR